MNEYPLRPVLADSAPTEDRLTDYDRAHLVTYLRLLDAAAEGVPWAEITRIVLDIDPSADPERARRIYESHLARARWMTNHGHRDFL